MDSMVSGLASDLKVGRLAAYDRCAKFAGQPELLDERESVPLRLLVAVET